MAKESILEGVPDSLPKDFVLHSGFTVGQVAAKNCDSVKLPKELPGDPDDYWLEPKYDGFRLICVVLDDEVHMYTRSMKRQDGRLPYLEAEILSAFSPGTVLDGEIIALQLLEDGKILNDFEHVQSIMLSNPAEAVRKSRDVRPLDYALFDMTFDAGEDLRNVQAAERRSRLMAHIERAESSGCKRLELSPIFECTEDMHSKMCDKGFEGTVAKRKDSLYENNGRGKGWYKIKTQWEIDVIALGYVDGSKGTAYDGLIGGIIFGQPPPDEAIIWKADQIKSWSLNCSQYIERGSCSGLELDHRMHISANRDDYVGRIMTIGHMGVYRKSPRLRHPQFKRWRPDKPIGDLFWHDR